MSISAARYTRKRACAEPLPADCRRLCPAGKYGLQTAADAEADCTPCGAGRYSGAQGATAATTCESCEAGVIDCQGVGAFVVTTVGFAQPSTIYIQTFSLLIFVKFYESRRKT